MLNIIYNFCDNKCADGVNERDLKLPSIRWKFSRHEKARYRGGARGYGGRGGGRRGGRGTDTRATARDSAEGARCVARYICMSPRWCARRRRSDTLAVKYR